VVVRLGLGIRLQGPPFEDTTTDEEGSPSGPVSAPTAVHALAEVQATEKRTAPQLELGGPETIDHVVPSQDSMRGTSIGALLLAKRPTATHSFAEVQATEISRLSVGLGFGLGTMDQDWPSQDSTRVWSPEAADA
jgi:hypothetical protein